MLALQSQLFISQPARIFTSSPEQIENELTVDFLERFVNEVSESGKRVLLLLDDVVNDIRKNKGVDRALAKILYNRRHITADGGDEASGFLFKI